MFWQCDFDLWCIYRIWLWASILCSSGLAGAEGSQQPREGDKERCREQNRPCAAKPDWLLALSGMWHLPGCSLPFQRAENANWAAWKQGRTWEGVLSAFSEQTMWRCLTRLVGFMVHNGGQFILPNAVLSRHSTEKKHVINNTDIYCSHLESQGSTVNFQLYSKLCGVKRLLWCTVGWEFSAKKYCY